MALRLIILTFGLFALWLLLSGIYTPLLLSLGAASCLFTITISARMGLFDVEKLPIQISVKASIVYFFWLGKEIAKANWAVSRIIASSVVNTKQKLFNVPSSQQSDVGKVAFANSITLTPGTITVETEQGYFLTHALSEEFADMDALEDMNKRVCKIEIRGARS